MLHNYSHSSSYFNLAIVNSYLKEYIKSEDKANEILDILDKCLKLDSLFFPARFEQYKIKNNIGKQEELSIEQKDYIEKNLPQYPICYYDYAKIILNTKNIKQKVILNKLNILTCIRR